MSNNGIGNDGYVRVQKETTFNTAASADMTLIPAAPDSLMTAKVMQIENDVQVGMRFKQDPNAGRVSCAGSMNMDMHPSIIGTILNLFLGASDADAAGGDDTYEHTWIQALTGVREGTSFTYEQALGIDTAERITGCTIHAIHITGDNEGNLKIACDMVGKDYTTDVTRITSFSYPSYIPFNFSHVTLNVNPEDVTAFDVNVTAFTLDIDLNYDIERYKTGSDSILQPVFNGVPIVNFSCDLDADSKFVNYARSLTPADLTLSVTSTEVAIADGAVWDFNVELPRCFLSQDTEIPNTNEYMTMSTDWDCSYGGYTTGSPAANVMFELRNTDLTAAYTG